MIPGIHLRPITAQDELFLRTVYASTREDELALTGWDNEQKEAFLRMQFDAQHMHYRERYAGASFLVIERRGEPIGRFYLADWPEEIRIIDIALLPHARNAGIGGKLLGSILDRAAQEGKAVSIHVERFNRAQHLYTRLGFKPEGERGVYMLMVWRPTNIYANTAS